MLGDLRIVEIGEGMAIQITGLMLGELGADVLKVERLGGDPSRSTASFACWNRGKRSLEIDFESANGMVELNARLERADVLIHQFSPVRAKALGLDDAALGSAFPQLVICSITGSPRNHPDVERSDDELLVAARWGFLYENDGYRAGPIVWRYQTGSWGAAHLAAGGILARLVERLQSGKGGVAHTSLAQGLLSQISLVWARNSKGPMPNPEPYSLGPRAMGQQLYQCKDGDWLQIMDPTRKLDYATLPTMWDVLAEGADLTTEVGTRQAFKQRPLADWMTDLRAIDIAVEPAFPMGELLKHEDVRANGYVIEIDDPVFGMTVQPNVPFHTDAPLKTAKPAPRLGEEGETGWQNAPAPVGSNGQAAYPLEGARVLDLGMFLAGPMGPSLMGDMGANVIKVEALNGDRIRFMHRYFQAASRSKRSLALDLTKPEAQPILERLIKWAEVLHHNMRFKGANKLGLSEEAIRKANPEIGFSYVSAYGQRGNRRDWPGYDSIFNAIAGWEFENAGVGNPPIFNRPGTMDVLSAQSCFVGTMALLYARRANGKGYSLHTSLLGVSAFSQGERLLLADGSLTGIWRLDSEQTGYSPYHRIFEARDGQWIAVAARSDAAKDGLRKVLGADEAGFADAARARTAPDLLAGLEATGVACDAVLFEDAMNRFFDDPHNRKLGLVSVVDQPLYGLIEQPGEFWDFGNLDMNIVQACPAIGQHSDEIMREMGYSDTEIAAFREAKVIG